jgi:ankyrin repeat protein
MKFHLQLVYSQIRIENSKQARKKKKMKPAGIEKKSFVETISYKHDQYDDYYNDSSDEDDYDYYGNENYTANGKTTTNESKFPFDSQYDSQKTEPESLPSISVNGHQTKQSSFQLAANPSISAKQMHESEDLLDLKHAIIHENILKVERFLLKPDVNINVTFNNGWSPLMYAVSVGSYELAKKFIEAGANVNHSAGE